ncbi:SDR family oxidoreductase [Geodermatophilus sp. SYSU D00815]
MTEILLCGGTGDLGGRIAARLAERGLPFRALARPTSHVAALEALGAEIAVGDLTDRPGLDRALTGIRTVVTTANGIGRSLAGDRSTSVDAVDVRGNENLVRAAEAAGVERFVFVSATGLTDLMVGTAPFMAAKLRTERLLRASAMPSVVVRPAPFQELWLSPQAGIRPDRRLAVVFGRGRSPSNDVATDDVAEACVRLATMADPPAVIELGGPEALTRQQVVDLVERAYGVRFRRLRVPRAVLGVGARALRRRSPELASLLGMALVRDLQGDRVDPEPLRRLGLEPRATSDRIAAMAREAALR